MDYHKGFRKKAFQSITPPSPAINYPVKVATLDGSWGSSWIDVEIDLYNYTVIKKTAAGSPFLQGFSFDADAAGYAFTTGETYVWYIMHLPTCGSSNYFSGDLQVDRVSTDNTLTNFKTFGDTTTGFDPHVGSSFWYERYKGTTGNSSLSEWALVNANANIFRQSINQNDVAVGTASFTVAGDVGGTGSSNTGLTTNRAGSTTGYYVYSETSGSSAQFNCKRYFLHQMPGLWTVGSGSTNRKWGVSLGMYGAHIGTVNIYVVRNS